MSDKKIYIVQCAVFICGHFQCGFYCVSANVVKTCILFLVFCVLQQCHDWEDQPVYFSSFIFVYVKLQLHPARCSM